MKVRSASRVVPFVTCVACLLGVSAARAQSTATTAGFTAVQVRRLGSVSLSALSAMASSAPSARTMAVASPAAPGGMFNRRVPGQFVGASHTPQLARTLKIPTVRSTKFATQTTPGFLGFNGIDAFDVATLNAGDIEPPDQALCAGNGEVVESVNLAITVFNTSGTVIKPPVALNTFFGVPTDFLSDPRCVYDSTTNVFFMSVTDLPSSNKSELLLAVLPASGATGVVYELDTTNDGTGGTPSHPNCPCLNDQPLLGVDANGVYLSANEFQINATNPSAGVFNGAQVYAFNKANLVSSTLPAVVLFASPLSIAGAPAASVQPANAPDGQFATNNGGTEYFLSALDFTGRLDSRIGLWALVNSCGLPSSTGVPKCSAVPTLSNVVLRSETYGLPPFEGNNFSAPGATQRSGPMPLGALNSDTLELLNTNDDRMNQVVYAGGKLYGGLNTVVSVRGGARGNAETGVAYFVVKPTINKRGALHGRMAKQGYVAHTDTNVFYPSIGVTTNGNAVMTFSLSGPSLFPSAGYMTLKQKAQISIMGAGADPDDGFSGYDVASIPFTSPTRGVGRWGDYSAAVADGNKIWIAAEYIPFACDSAQYGTDRTCGGTRGQYSNWGTFVGALTFP